MSSRYPTQSVCENPFQGDWKIQAAFYPTSRQPWIATAAALTMGRFPFLMPSAQSWRESDVELGIKRPMVSASAAAAANNLELQIICSCNRCGTDHGPFRPKLAWQRRRCHASFGHKNVASPRPLHGVLETRQRLLTATYNIGVQCWVYSVWEMGILSEEMQCKNHEMSPHLFIILEENSRQNCFASSMLPSLLAYVGIKTWRKQTCLPHPQVYSLPSGHYLLQWQPPKHHTLRSIQSIHNKTSTKTQALH